MAKNELIKVSIFGIEIGKIGYDIDHQKSFFQFHRDFLQSNQHHNIFPFLFKRVQTVQVFSQYNSDTFQGLPPMIADSLPDTFGNIIFQEWLLRQGIHKVSPLEQLAYVANRGMGALEYQPIKTIPYHNDLDLNHVISVLQKVLKLKENTLEKGLNELALLNVFKIGTSAGGARPKILISEHKETGHIIPGDQSCSNAYHHYLVKLHLQDHDTYHRELVEYAYYLLATKIGIEMMPSKMIDHKHFATLRYDRQNGEKQHVLTATGLTGWDFKTDHKNASYENLFELAIALKVTHQDLQQLFKRMIFNVVFQNIDDHLKNHSFIYDQERGTWKLAPAYDLTFALNPLFTFKNVTRALSINHKRSNITLEDVLVLAEKYAIKNTKRIISEVNNLTQEWKDIANTLQIDAKIVTSIDREITKL